MKPDSQCNRAHLLSVIAIIAALTSGCASEVYFPGASADTVNNGTIKGIDPGAAALTPIYRAVSIFKVDGVKVNTAGATYLLHIAPGKYKLTISCSSSTLFGLDIRSAELDTEIQRGHTYQLDAAASCKPVLVDITNSTG